MEREIFFFHHSDTPRNWVTDVDPKHQLFLWYSDRFHELTAIGSRYVYFFFVNPRRDGARLYARPYGGGFHGLHTTFLLRKPGVDPVTPLANRWMNEPAFVSTYSPLQPRGSAEFDPVTESYTILTPENHRGKQFFLFDRNRQRIPFAEVDVLREVFPDLLKTFPFVTPQIVNEKYVYPDWRDIRPGDTFNLEGFEEEVNSRKG